MYEAFAEVYDEFMEEIPYTQWADYIETLLDRFQIPSRLDPVSGSAGEAKEPTRSEAPLILDLGCGTGGLALELWHRGYDMIAADLSPEMLDKAREKAEAAGALHQILFLQQDMRAFELYGTVDAILILCDSLNYLLEEAEVQRVFELAENYLNPGGLLIFDVNSIFKYARVLGDETFADTREDAAFIWENHFDEASGINEYQVTFFIREGPGSYGRYEEIHQQRGYELDLLKKALKKAHLKVEGVLDAFSLESPTAKSERVFFVARATREKRI